MGWQHESNISQLLLFDAHPIGCGRDAQEDHIELEQPARADEPEGHRDRKAQGEQNDGHDAGDALIHLEIGIFGKCRRIDQEAEARIISSLVLVTTNFLARQVMGPRTRS